MMKTLCSTVLAAALFCAGCANAPETDPPAAAHREQTAATPAPAKEVLVDPIIRDNTGVWIRKNRTTGEKELIVDPFPEERVLNKRPRR